MKRLLKQLWMLGRRHIVRWIKICRPHPMTRRIGLLNKKSRLRPYYILVEEGACFLLDAVLIGTYQIETHGEVTVYHSNRNLFIAPSKILLEDCLGLSKLSQLLKRQWFLKGVACIAIVKNSLDSDGLGTSLKKLIEVFSVCYQSALPVYIALGGSEFNDLDLSLDVPADSSREIIHTEITGSIDRVLTRRLESQSIIDGAVIFLSNRKVLEKMTISVQASPYVAGVRFSTNLDFANMSIEAFSKKFSKRVKHDRLVGYGVHAAFLMIMVWVVALVTQNNVRFYQKVRHFHNVLEDLPFNEKTNDEGLLSVYSYFSDYHKRVPLSARQGVIFPAGLQRVAAEVGDFYVLNKYIRSELEELEAKLNNCDQASKSCYRYLRAYLMVFHPRYLDEKFVSSLSSNTAAVNHYLYRLKNNKTLLPMKVNSEVVDKARKVLLEVDPAERWYWSLSEKWQLRGGKLSLSELIYLPGLSVFMDSQNAISMVYTPVGAERWVRPAIQQFLKNHKKSDWVSEFLALPAGEDCLSTRECRKKVREKLYQYYFKDYSSAWAKFISGLTLQDSHSLSELSAGLASLAGSSGILVRLFNELMVQFDSNHFENLSKSAELLGFPINLDGWFETAVSDSGELGRYLLNLKKWSNDLALLSDGSSEMVDYVSGVKSCLHSQSVLCEMYRAVKTLRMPSGNEELLRSVQQLLLSIIQKSWSVLLTETVGTINTRWQKIVFPEASMVVSHFPFQRQAKMIGQSKLDKFFDKESGVLPKFYQDFIKPLENSPSWLGSYIVPRKDWIEAWNVFQALERTYSRIEQLQLEFAFLPDPNSKSLTIQSGEERQVYLNGQLSWFPYSNWLFQPIELKQEGIEGENTIIKRYSGAWGGWQLLRNTKYHCHSSRLIEFTSDYVINGRKQLVKFQVRGKPGIEGLVSKRWEHLRLPEFAVQVLDG